MVKEKPIANLEDSGEVENTIRNIIALVIANVQNSLKWNELLESDNLTLASTETEDGWYKYHAPSGLLQIESIKAKNGAYSHPFKREGRYIYTPTANAVCKYYKKNYNPYEWSDELKECVIIALSAKIATALTADFNAGITLQDIYDKRQKHEIRNVKHLKNESTPKKRKFGNWNIRKFR